MNIHPALRGMFNASLGSDAFLPRIYDSESIIQAPGIYTSASRYKYGKYDEGLTLHNRNTPELLYMGMGGGMYNMPQFNGGGGYPPMPYGSDPYAMAGPGYGVSPGYGTDPYAMGGGYPPSPYGGGDPYAMGGGGGMMMDPYAMAGYGMG